MQVHGRTDQARRLLLAAAGLAAAVPASPGTPGPGGAAAPGSPPAPPAARARVHDVEYAVRGGREVDPAILFADDFERPGELRSRYFEYDAGRGGASFLRDPNGGCGGRGAAMKCQFERGQVSAGGLKVLFGRSPLRGGIRPAETFREVFWRVYVKHEPGWEGNPLKLARVTCLASPNWAQGLIAHVWGGRGAMLEISPATGIRESRRVSTRYNDFANLRWLGGKPARTPLFSAAEAGRWVCIESRVRLNTPGRNDGLFALWIDGRLEASHEALDWHGRWEEYGINAFFLENYWNEGSVRRQARWFDNLALSTAPIGPAAAGPAPRFARTPVPALEWQAQVAVDPEGRRIVWTSRPAPGTSLRMRIDPASGSFEGSLAGRADLGSVAVCWLRLRERNPSGQWSGWSPWHAPFRVVPGEPRERSATIRQYNRRVNDGNEVPAPVAE